MSCCDYEWEEEKSETRKNPVLLRVQSEGVQHRWCVFKALFSLSQSHPLLEDSQAKWKQALNANLKLQVGSDLISSLDLKAKVM